VQPLKPELSVLSLLDALNLEPAPDHRQRLVRIALSHQDSVLLPLEQITEILQVNVADVLSVPELPNSVLGICNWRGEMLWLVDLCQVTGYPSSFQQEPLPAFLFVMVIHNHHQTVGIGVREVNDIELHDLQQLQPVFPGVVSPGLLPLVWGLLPDCNDPVLNMKAIVEYPLWKKQTIKA
jgi:positive phototaxis protein PixI